jgi:hypothetical protein
MTKLILLPALVALTTVLGALAADNPKDTRCYEMRTYFAAPGKLADLQARFRNHTCKLFEKHGMESIGYWLPLDNPDNKLIYLLAYPSREAREKSWKEFMSDPIHQRAYQAFGDPRMQIERAAVSGGQRIGILVPPIAGVSRNPAQLELRAPTRRPIRE